MSLLSKFAPPFVSARRLPLQSNPCRSARVPKRVARHPAVKSSIASLVSQIDLLAPDVDSFEAHSFWDRISAAARAAGYAFLVDAQTPVESLGLHVVGVFTSIIRIFQQIYNTIADILTSLKDPLKKFTIACSVLMEALFKHLLSIPAYIGKMVDVLMAVLSVSDETRSRLRSLLPGSFSPLPSEEEDSEEVDSFDANAVGMFHSAFTVLLSLGSAIMYGAAGIGSSADPAYYCSKINTIAAFAQNMERINPYQNARKIANCLYKAYSGQHLFEDLAAGDEFNTHYKLLLTQIESIRTLANPPPLRLVPSANRSKSFAPLIMLCSPWMTPTSPRSPICISLWNQCVPTYVPPLSDHKPESSP